VGFAGVFGSTGVAQDAAQLRKNISGVARRYSADFMPPDAKLQVLLPAFF